jgi:glycosyltransferase involved in cell wall biosynthesis
MYYEARARATPREPYRSLLAIEARRFARFDRRHLAAYDLLITMSEDEREDVRKLSDRPIVAIPNGVDTSALPPAPPEPDGAEPLLLFAGTLSYRPNAEAAEWLLRKVWPRVREAHPSARLEIVGRGAPAEVQRLIDERVSLPGFVPNIADRYAQAAVVTVPLLSGAGTKLKLLEGLASGRPVVSTPLGAQGVDVRHGEHLLLAEGADSFAAAIIDLLGDSRVRSELAAHGRRLAEARYDWRVLGERYARALADLKLR